MADHPIPILKLFRKPRRDLIAMSSLRPESRTMRVSASEAFQLAQEMDGPIPSHILERHCPLDEDRYDASGKSSSHDLGDLSVLPYEIQEMIIKNVDIQSLLEFRRVNKYAMHFVTELLEWKKIRTHCADALRITIGLDTHRFFTITDLFEVMCTTHCARCNSPATLVEMFRFARYCQDCCPQRAVKQAMGWLRPLVGSNYGSLYLRREWPCPPTVASRTTLDWGMYWRLVSLNADVYMSHHDFYMHLDMDLACVEVPWLSKHGMGTVTELNDD